MKQIGSALEIQLWIVLGAMGFTALCVSSARSQDVLPRPRFEVVSIKRNTSLDPRKGLQRGPVGGLNASNVSLRFLVTFAYNIRDYQLVGGPGWTDSEGYDILAKPGVGGGTELDHNPPLDLVRLKTQALLIDRFRLVVHRETKEMPIYALEVAKHGPRLERSKGEDSPQIIGGPGRLTCKKISMKRFADLILSQRLGRRVFDHTGLGCEFDFTIESAPDKALPREGGLRLEARPIELSGPSFVEAIQEQLGLRLQSRRGPVEMLVIDSAEKASAN